MSVLRNLQAQRFISYAKNNHGIDFSVSANGQSVIAIIREADDVDFDGMVQKLRDSDCAFTIEFTHQQLPTRLPVPPDQTRLDHVVTYKLKTQLVTYDNPPVDLNLEVLIDRNFDKFNKSHIILRPEEMTYAELVGSAPEDFEARMFLSQRYGVTVNDSSERY